MDSRPLAPPEVIEGATYERHGYPHAVWTRLRRDAPVAWCDVPGYPRFWAVTRYADVVQISKRPDLFVNSRGTVALPKSQISYDDPLTHNLLTMDPPEHRTYRGLMSDHFKPRAIAPKKADVSRIAHTLLDAVAGRESIDFVAEVAAVLPLAVIAEMLGVAPEDRDRFVHITNRIIGAADPEFQEGTPRETSEAAFKEGYAYFAELVKERRVAPREDLASVLMLLVAAGFETTRNATSGGLLALLEAPGALDALRGNPGGIDTAVEEILRWTSPVIHFMRTATRDVELGKVTVRAGERVALFYPSANRDEAVFENANEFRVGRSPNRHIAFGIGEHVCLGAHLARLELRAMFGALLGRLDRIELAGPVERLRSSFIGGIKHLPLKLSLLPAPTAGSPPPRSV
jgi:cholest-4-en-3-one 26-monooxygenase